MAEERGDARRYLPTAFAADSRQRLRIGLGVDRTCRLTGTVFRPGLPTRTGRHLILAIRQHLLSRGYRPVP